MNRTAWADELAKKVKVLADEASRQAVAADFGRVVNLTPRACVRPASAQAVAQTVKFASKHSLQVRTRGAGHSQNGRSLSEHIVVEMRGLNRMVRLDPERRTVTCQAGMTWRELVQQLLPFGLSPPVLTNNLDVTLGGSLSTGGLGVSSWRHGTQADHCLELEVVTGSGEILHCSPQLNAELFDAARGGLGRFGVITEVTLRLRAHKPRVETFYLLYDDLSALLSDLEILMREERFDYLESWCAPLLQGMRKNGGERRPFAQWFYPLHATVETESAAASEGAEKLGGLNFYKHVHTESGEIAEFFTRLDPLFALWKRGGFWDFAHPWMECLLPWKSAPAYIHQALERLPPEMMMGGHILLWPARSVASSVPLFVKPEGENVMGFGILPAVPVDLLGGVLPLLGNASEAAMRLGGKRYLSGWLGFGPGQWQEHFGEMWPALGKLKTKYDPGSVYG